MSKSKAITSTQENQRISFSSAKGNVVTPDFLDIQLQSFKEFFQLDTLPEDRVNEGLYKTFQENFPITDSRNQFVLEFLDYLVDSPRYSIDECVERGLTYSVPLKARLKLYCTDPEHEDFQTVIQDVYLGPVPYMTPSGSFIINGAERVIVTQLHRSPGVQNSRRQSSSFNFFKIRFRYFYFFCKVENLKDIFIRLITDCSK